MNEKHVELRHLRYFLEVVEANSFTRAATNLGISQPTLSQQIRRLEEILEVNLFTRSGRTIRLASAGDAFLPHAQDAVRAADAGMRSIVEALNLEGGKLHIASIPSLNVFIARAAASFLLKYPKIRLVQQEHIGLAIHGLVRNGDVELGFCVGSSVPSDVAAKFLFKEEMVLAFRETHPLAQLDNLSLEDLGNTPFVIFSYETFTRNSIDNYFKRMGFSPNICLEVASVDSLLHVIAGTNAIGVVPEHSINSRPGIRFCQCLDRQSTRAIVMLSHPKTTVSVAAQEFGKIVCDEARRMK